MAPTASVLVCRGCCCGTDDEAAAAAQVERLRNAVAVLPKGRVTLTDCLGPCGARDLVAVRHRDTDRPGKPLATTWFRHVDDAAIDQLAEWVRDGAADDVPDGLRARRFTPAAEGADSVRPDEEIMTSRRVR